MHSDRVLEAAQHHLATVGEDQAFARDQLSHHIRDQHLPTLGLPPSEPPR